MSRENVEIVRRAYDLGPVWDVATMRRFVLELCDPKVEWTPVEATDSFHGHDGVIQSFQEWIETMGELRIEPQEFIDAGDHVVVATRQRATGQTSGVDVEALIFQVATLRDGKVVRFTEYVDRREALEAVGLLE